VGKCALLLSHTLPNNIHCSMMADDHCLKSDSGHEDSGDDHNGDEIAENEQSQGSVRVVSGSGFRYVIPFPWRLHQMLEEIEQAGDASVVSWLPNGHHFQVHIPQQFVDKVIPKFFKQKSYKSFQRQLHLYGFQRETDGPNRGKKIITMRHRSSISLVVYPQ